MKLGVAGLLADGSPAAAAQVRALGFSSASWHLPSLEVARNRLRLQSVREALANEGVEMCQLLPPSYPSLVDPDPQARSAGVEALRTVLEAAQHLGAGSVYVRPGSLSPAGPWTPHPKNHSRETRERLVESLREVAWHAGAAGVPLALEGHVVSPVDSPAVCRQVLDAVDSPWLRFNLDPVNFVATIDRAYDPAPLLEELFESLGNSIVAAHAKDVTVSERLVVHIDECAPGEGFLDLEQFLLGFAKACPAGTVLIEHLPAERVPAARDALLAAAERAGLQFEGT